MLTLTTDIHNLDFICLSKRRISRETHRRFIHSTYIPKPRGPPENMRKIATLGIVLLLAAIPWVANTHPAYAQAPAITV